MQSRRRITTNGRMTLPYSDCLKSPRRISAIDQTKEPGFALSAVKTGSAFSLELSFYWFLKGLFEHDPSLFHMSHLHHTRPARDALEYGFIRMLRHTCLRS